MKPFNEEELRKHAYNIRRMIISTIATNGEGHAGGALSVTDCLTAVAFAAMSDERDPILRDKLILSSGHKCLALYSMLVERGDLKESELKTYNMLGSRFPGHPDATKIPEIDFSTGSLGHGLPVGCGYAIAAKKRGLDYRTFVLMGDGEQGEGSNWEAAAFAAQNKLDNLVAILDENRLQINGRPEEICKPTDFEDRYGAFGWDVQSVCGHDMKAIYKALEDAMIKNGKPHLIVAKTTKGKGLSFMEDNVKYHHWNPSQEQGREAQAEFEALGRQEGWI